MARTLKEMAIAFTSTMVTHTERSSLLQQQQHLWAIKNNDNGHIKLTVEGPIEKQSQTSNQLKRNTYIRIQRNLKRSSTYYGMVRRATGKCRCECWSAPATLLQGTQKVSAAFGQTMHHGNAQ